MVDPITTDFSDTDISDEFSEWLKKNATDNVRRLKIRDLQDTVDNQISDHGNSPKKIHLNIVLPKTDMGYLAEWANPNQPEMLRRFIEEEMGLGDLLHWAGKFADINFYALGAIARGDQANIAPILDRIISGQLGIRL